MQRTKTIVTTGLLLLAVALSGCGGTIDRLKGHHAPLVPAQVIAINRTSGLAGESVGFTALIATGTGQANNALSYLWDFGTAGTPRYSTAAQPAGVKLTSVPGAYPIKLTVFTGRTDFELLDGGTANSDLPQTVFELPDFAVLSPAAVQAAVLSMPTVSGAPGEAALLEPELWVRPDLTGIKYAWRFGVGADPQTVETTEPRVGITLAEPAAAAYDATLTVTCNGDERQLLLTHSFKYIVAELAAGAVTASGTAAGTSVVFSVEVQKGRAGSYLWDFGDGGSTAGPTAAAPAVQLSDQPGTYQGQLILTNAYEILDVQFSYEVQ